MADRNPSRRSNWKMVCKVCRAAGVTVEWLSRETLGIVQQHFIDMHGTEEVQFELVWIGKGPAPKAQPKWN